MPPERELEMLAKRLSAAEERLIDIREAVVEHRTRLQNGVKVFADQKDRLETVEKKIEPKPPSVYKIIGITLTVVLAGAGALWALANMLRDRPTIDQIDRVIDSHDISGHEGMKNDVRSVQVEQGQQRILIEDVQMEQKSQGKKLDTLLNRTLDTPSTSPRNRRGND